MNWFLMFWHHLLNPHCQECAQERQETNICASCEVLKQELAISHQNYRELLNKLIEKPESEVKKEPPIITQPLVRPWKVKQQILEKEDRIKAEAMRMAGKPTLVKPTEELEKEIAN